MAYIYQWTVAEKYAADRAIPRRRRPKRRVCLECRIEAPVAQGCCDFCEGPLVHHKVLEYLQEVARTQLEQQVREAASNAARLAAMRLFDSGFGAIARERGAGIAARLVILKSRDLDPSDDIVLAAVEAASEIVERDLPRERGPLYRNHG